MRNSDKISKLYSPSLFTHRLLTDDILKMNSFQMNNTYGSCLFGLIHNSQLMPDGYYYYVIQFSGGLTGADLKTTIAICINNGYKIFISNDIHCSDTPTWKSIQII